MRLKIAHTTHYLFGQPVSHGLQRLRLSPKTTQGQKVLAWQMTYEGAIEQARFEDHNHNHVVLVSVVPGVSEVTIRCEGVVATADNHGVIGHHSGHMPLWAFLSQSPLTRPGPKVRAIMSGLDVPREETVPLLHRLSTLVREAIDYIPGDLGPDHGRGSRHAWYRGVPGSRACLHRCRPRARPARALCLGLPDDG